MKIIGKYITSFWRPAPFCFSQDISTKSRHRKQNQLPSCSSQHSRQNESANEMSMVYVYLCYGIYVDVLIFESYPK